MNFIKEIFDNKAGETSHIQFQKFSKGVFKDRALIKIKVLKDKYIITTTYEFVNDFVRTLSEKVKDNKIKVNGAIISTLDLDKKIKFKSKKQFMGVKQYVIEDEMTGNEVLRLINEMPKILFALSFDFKDYELKIKAKAPKSAKPKNKEEESKPDFCKLITKDKDIVKEFLFEKDSFKEAEISHDFLIEDIIIPKELENEKDFSVIREKSLRKGKIIRKALIDGKEIKTEKEFLV
jgi:hypothetical protein